MGVKISILVMSLIFFRGIANATPFPSETSASRAESGVLRDSSVLEAIFTEWSVPFTRFELCEQYRSDFQPGFSATVPNAARYARSRRILQDAIAEFAQSGVKTIQTGRFDCLEDDEISSDASVARR